MKRSAVPLLAIIAMAGLVGNAPAKTAPDPGYSYYEIGDTKAPRPAATEKALLLVGGGQWNKEAFRWFAGKTGHGHLVVIGAYGGGEDGEEFYRNIGGFMSVQTLVFTDRKAAFDPRVLKVLHDADGIFIEGGDQSKYVRFWKGTPVAQAIDSAVTRGRPVGGTSAGLAVLGAYAYGAMDGGSIDSRTALRDPLGPAVTIVRNFLHMPFLQHVVTDTHFAARDRQGRLVAFLAQVRSKWDPRAIGLAVDESSALCVDADGIGRFFTNKDGKAWLIQPAGVPSVRPRKPLDWASVKVTRFGTDGSIDLESMKVRNPSSIVITSVNHGLLRGI